MKQIILTGDRPSGNLHIGHYAGSLRKRVEMQNSGKYEIYILIADLQALTDNAQKPEKVSNSVEQIMLDLLAVGLTPDKVSFVLQSAVPALFELPMYYANLVTQARLERNPTVKEEIKLRGFSKDVPVGFVNYPISQAADITAFGAHLVPVGGDQLPMIEQTREIVTAFNRIYKTDALVLPQGLIPEGDSKRLPGTDGNGKMSKSRGNCIYLKDTSEQIKAKVMSMYTDPNHIRAEDPGEVKGNVVFTYLDAFCTDEDFAKYLPQYKNLDELKKHYKQGGLGDVKIKNFLFAILDNLLKPIRERRAQYEMDRELVKSYLRQGTQNAVEKTNEMLTRVRSAIGLVQL